MIYIWHGRDQKTLYLKLSTQFYAQSDKNIIKLTTDKTKTELEEALIGQSLFENKTIVVCEDFIKNKKIDTSLLNILPKDTTVIFWEKDQLPRETLAKYTKLAQIEEFKEIPILYQFLDSIIPNSRQMFKLLQKIKLEEGQSLIWQLSNRFFYLILAKKALSYASAQSVSRNYLHSNIQDWQWQKIKNQSQKFEISQLLAIFKSSLQIDNLIKNGKTDLPQKTLITMLLLKYI